MRSMRILMSLLLSTTYFVIAISIWAVREQELTIQADVDNLLVLPTIVPDEEILTTQPQTSTSPRPSSGPTPNQTVAIVSTSPVALVATGGSLGFNLLLATIASLATAYLFLRRRTV